MNGRVEHLYLQPVRGQPGVALAPDAAMRCEAGLGIHGDVHAHRLSPRQVLVTLASELRDLRIAPGALLENIVISSDRPELFRPGSALVTASGVEIRLTMFCEPCKRIAPVAADFSRLVHRRGVLGVFATSGEIRIGDAVRLIGERYMPLPDSAYQKFLAFVPTIPPSRVVRYVDVTVAIGVAEGFVRALPGYIRRSAGLGLPLHRIVNARGALLPFIPGQAGKLLAEGVIQRSDAATVDLAAFLWQGAA